MTSDENAVMPDEQQHPIIQRIVETVLASGRSMRDVSLKAGLNPDYIAILAKGKSLPKYDTVVKIARELNIDHRWLLGETSDQAAFQPRNTAEVPLSWRVPIIGTSSARDEITPGHFELSGAESIWLPPDARYPNSSRFGLRVIDNHGGEIIKNNGIAICIDMPENLEELSSYDIIVCEINVANKFYRRLYFYTNLPRYVGGVLLPVDNSMQPVSLLPGHRDLDIRERHPATAPEVILACGIAKVIGSLSPH